MWHGLTPSQTNELANLRTFPNFLVLSVLSHEEDLQYYQVRLVSCYGSLIDTLMEGSIYAPTNRTKRALGS